MSPTIPESEDQRGKKYSPFKDKIDGWAYTNELKSGFAKSLDGSVRGANWWRERGIDFQGELEADEAPFPVFHGVGTSSLMDFEDEVMEMSALESLASTTPIGQNVFMNHDHRLPDPSFGNVCVPVEVTTRVNVTDDKYTKLGSKIGVAIYHIRVHDNNPGAMMIHGFVERGTRIGLSTGFGVEEFEPIYGKDGDISGAKIYLVRSYEISTVGIPANPISWVESAMRGLRMKGLLPNPEKERAWVETKYILKNWGDIQKQDPLLALRLKKLNDELLMPNGLFIGKLPS